MKHPKVSLISNNHCIINTQKGRYLQSYKSIIAFIPNKGKIQLSISYWDYSTTTGKHRNQFLGMNKTETLKAIKNKEILMKNLN